MSRHDDNGAILLRGARVVLPGAVEEGASVLVEGGRIARVLPASESRLPNADEVLDLNGHTLFPGFIDVHNHGAAGVDTLEATTDDLHRVARTLAKYGVTAWLPTLVPATVEDYARAAEAVTQLMDESRRHLRVHVDFITKAFRTPLSARAP